MKEETFFKAESLRHNWRAYEIYLDHLDKQEELLKKNIPQLIETGMDLVEREVIQKLHLAAHKNLKQRVK